MANRPPTAPPREADRKRDTASPAEVLAASTLVPAPVESWLELLLDRVEVRDDR